MVESAVNFILGLVIVSLLFSLLAMAVSIMSLYLDYEERGERRTAIEREKTREEARIGNDGIR